MEPEMIPLNEAGGHPCSVTSCKAGSGCEGRSHRDFSVGGLAINNNR